MMMLVLQQLRVVLVKGHLDPLLLFKVDLRYGVEHSAQCSGLIGDQLSSDPSDSRHTSGVESNVADDRNKDQSTRPTNLIALNFQRRQIDRDVAE